MKKALQNAFYVLRGFFNGTNFRYNNGINNPQSLFEVETMWHAPEGETTFSGPYGLMLANGIRLMIDEMITTLDIDEEFQSGHRAFDCLTEEQKIWTLHKVAFGLLDPDTPICKLTAFLEATIATVFRQIEQWLEYELNVEAEDDFEPENQYDWRKIILAAYETTGLNSPENLDAGEQPLTVQCTEIDDWYLALEIIEGRVLWDADYDMDEFDDVPPDHAAAMKYMLCIDDDYFSSIPEDPKRSVAKKLMKETAKFCDQVIKREEKALEGKRRKKS